LIKNINAIKAVDGLGLVLNLKLALNNIKKENKKSFLLNLKINNENFK